MDLQSTLRKPAVQNMRKALHLQYSVGLVIYYGVSMVGYWAYGSTVSEYLPKELSGPKWVKVLINSAAFVQSIISQHVSSFWFVKVQPIKALRGTHAPRMHCPHAANICPI